MFASAPSAWSDWHTHATFYRGVDPRESARLEPMISTGAELGLQMMGIGEHVNGQPKPAPKYYERLARDLRRGSFPIPAYLMAEVDILDEVGHISNPDGLLQRTRPDVVIASVQRPCRYTTLDEYLNIYHALMMGAVTAENGAHILGHPWHSASRLVDKGIVSAWHFGMIPRPMLDELIDALCAHKVALEINSRWLSLVDDPHLRAFVQRAREAGVRVAVGSDAHTPERMASAVALNRFLEEMGFTREQLWLPERAR